MRRGHIKNEDGTESGSRIGILKDDVEWFSETFAPGMLNIPFGLLFHRLREALMITLTDDDMARLRKRWDIDEEGWEHERKHMVLDAANLEHYRKEKGGH